MSVRAFVCVRVCACVCVRACACSILIERVSDASSVRFAY